MWLSAMLPGAIALQAGISVVLNWQAPPKSADAVAGYNIYRMNSASSAWVRINKKLVHSATYKDKTVQRGQSYSYSIRSVDAKGDESAPSSPWSVTIPKTSKQKVIEVNQGKP